MITLAKFVGELIKDLADARTFADYHAASTSELYHADPFVKNLPIPHYIIEEAEIEVPLIIIGVSKDSEEFNNQKEKMVEVIKNKLPLLLLRNYKWNYGAERLAQKQQKEKEIESENQIQEEMSKKKNNIQRDDGENDKASPELLEMYNKSAKMITQKMIKHFEHYVYNYEILKLLEITEDFSRTLMRYIIADMKNYDKDSLPYFSNESINKAVNYIGNFFFFDFKQIMQTDTGVNVEPATGLMNEYAGKDTIMHVKIKVREQDLNLNVEDNKGKEKRYLSLT